MYRSKQIRILMFIITCYWSKNKCELKHDILKKCSYANHVYVLKLFFFLTRL